MLWTNLELVIWAIARSVGIPGSTFGRSLRQLAPNVRSPPGRGKVSPGGVAPPSPWVLGTPLSGELMFFWSTEREDTRCPLPMLESKIGLHFVLQRWRSGVPLLLTFL